jgi:hypothetical protein
MKSFKTFLWFFYKTFAHFQDAIFTHNQIWRSEYGASGHENITTEYCYCCGSLVFKDVLEEAVFDK